ncbi:hypothetical protein K2173_023879 [Erythroxylum novogranatense]|uniref:Uncharacterized protein n=1 Tax=Erythroxylum novogranatense TaxID=1862640 RepID=A0AAV8TSN0_9ROSI|nr:hypothetical protein K2173_023879 [Erythroxylum novogranatense]
MQEGRGTLRSTSAASRAKRPLSAFKEASLIFTVVPTKFPNADSIFWWYQAMGKWVHGPSSKIKSISRPVYSFLPLCLVLSFPCPLPPRLTPSTINSKLQSPLANSSCSIIKRRIWKSRETNMENANWKT